MDGDATPVGFLGLGLMGEAIARRLAQAGVPLLVWNRTPAKAASLARDGARVARTPQEVFAACDIVLEMLADATAVDAVLGRGTDDFARLVAGRTLVHLGTTAPTYSASLAADVTAAGGTYVEAPVSGSRLPAERGELAGMVAGPRAAVERVTPLLRHFCTEVVDCGEVPRALTTKLAVNLFLVTMVTGLAEAYHFAECHGLDLERFVRVLDAGPMASSVSRMKLAKLLGDDLSPQAGLSDVLMNTVLIDEAAREARIAAPLVATCRELYGEAVGLQRGPTDMIGVVGAHRARTASAGSAA